MQISNGASTVPQTSSSRRKLSSCLIHYHLRHRECPCQVKFHFRPTALRWLWQTDARQAYGQTDHATVTLSMSYHAAHSVDCLISSYLSQWRRGKGSNCPFPINFSLSENFLSKVQNLGLEIPQLEKSRTKLTIWIPIYDLLFRKIALQLIFLLTGHVAAVRSPPAGWWCRNEAKPNIQCIKVSYLSHNRLFLDFYFFTFLVPFKTFLVFF